MNERRKELEKMTVLKELAPLAKSYGLDVDHLRKGEIIEEILKYENPPKKTRPPRNFAPTKLKAARLKAGMTQAELSRLTGINSGTLKHYEQGSKSFDNAKFNVIFNTCIILNCRIEDLIEDENTLDLFKRYNEKHS